MNSIQTYYRHRYAGKGCSSWPKDELFGPRSDMVLRMAGPRPKRVLDFGCNVGILTKKFRDAGHQVVGVDISESAIENARNHIKGVRFESIESETQLPFETGSFDVCVATEIIEHLFDTKGFIHEIFRILVPNGLFLLSTPYHGLVKNVITALIAFEKHFSPYGGHIRFFSKKSLGDCLKSAGFNIGEVHYLGRFWPVWKDMVVKARKVLDEPCD